MAEFGSTPSGTDLILACASQSVIEPPPRKGRSRSSASVPRAAGPFPDTERSRPADGPDTAFNGVTGSLCRISSVSAPVAWVTNSREYFGDLLISHHRKILDG